MLNVIMQPSVNKNNKLARINWDHSIEHEIPFSEYAEILSHNDRARLDALHPSGQARFWGSTKKQDSNYQKIATGDIVLFTGDKKVWLSALWA